MFKIISKYNFILFLTSFMFVTLSCKKGGEPVPKYNQVDIVSEDVVTPTFRKGDDDGEDSDESTDDSEGGGGTVIGGDDGEDDDGGTVIGGDDGEDDDGGTKGGGKSIGGYSDPDPDPKPDNEGIIKI